MFKAIKHPFLCFSYVLFILLVAALFIVAMWVDKNSLSHHLTNTGGVIICAGFALGVGLTLIEG